MLIHINTKRIRVDLKTIFNLFNLQTNALNHVNLLNLNIKCFFRCIRQLPMG